MKTDRTILCVVPQHVGNPEQNPGGQITAANGLLEYFQLAGYAAKVLNTASPSFPKKSLYAKVLESIKRVFASIPILARKETEMAVLFTGAGLSLLERLVICALCRLFGVRSLLFFRNSDILDSGSSGLRRYLVGFACRLPSKLVVQGLAWKTMFSSMGIDLNKVVVVPNWLPPGFNVAKTPKECADHDQLHFIFVGWMTEVKGVRILLDAVELLLPRTDFQLTLVGGGTLEKEARERAAISGWDHVHVEGWKSQNDIKGLLDNSHVFVLPTAHKEGFPNALLEAMSRGLAAISTMVGAIPESLRDGENGMIVPQRDSAALAAAMSRYLDDPHLVRTHAENTLKVVKERHNANANCKTLLKALQET